jgi:uncharacterized membrane protein YkvI
MQPTEAIRWAITFSVALIIIALGAMLAAFITNGITIPMLVNASRELRYVQWEMFKKLSDGLFTIGSLVLLYLIIFYVVIVKMPAWKSSDQSPKQPPG